MPTPETGASPRRWTAQEIKDLGATTTLEVAAEILNLKRSTAYGLARDGKFPCLVITTGGRRRVVVHSLLDLLGMTAT